MSNAVADADHLRQKRPIIIDALGFIANPNLRMMGSPGAGLDDPDKGVDSRSISDALASGLTATNVTLGYVAGNFDPFEYTVREIGQYDALIRRNPDQLLKVLSTSDILRAHESGRVGLIFGFQNATMLGDDATRAEIFSNLGVRVIQLTYNVRNQLGDGSMVAENRGLTEFGREAVHELNRNNVLVDLSHSGEQTCLDALHESEKPIAITHSGCRALAELPRNKTDEELKILADKGGVVGIYFMPFLAIGRQTLADDLVRHIEHALDVCGEDHVGIGTDGTVTAIDDMDKYRIALNADIVPFLPDLTGTEKFWKLADMLAERGHSSARIEKILGGNFLRLMGDTWSGA
jgi:membrane dipeptidase